MLIVRRQGETAEDDEDEIESESNEMTMALTDSEMLGEDGADQMNYGKDTLEKYFKLKVLIGVMDTGWHSRREKISCIYKKWESERNKGKKERA